MAFNSNLRHDKIIQTIELLELRIQERFPNANLVKLCDDFLLISKNSSKNIEWLAKPDFRWRSLSFLITALGVGLIVYTFSLAEVGQNKITFTYLITLAEASVNNLVLLGAALFFLFTLETRVKRSKALNQLNQLRALAHVVDMHQLTKDPNMRGEHNLRTDSSPKRELSNFELKRYLEYCSEMLSLIGKVAALYAQNLPDDVVINSANDIEVLTTGLSQKIWQKLTILNQD